MQLLESLLSLPLASKGTLESLFLLNICTSVAPECSVVSSASILTLSEFTESLPVDVIPANGITFDPFSSGPSCVLLASGEEASLS